MSETGQTHLQAEMWSQTEIDANRYTVLKKRFIFEDEGGTAQRGKLRIEKTVENRPYAEAVKKIAQSYDFDSVSNIQLKHVNE
jgi:hypothetical protein